MKIKLLAAAALLTLTGCATPVETQLTLAPKAVPSSIVAPSGSEINITSRDLRSAQFVAIVDSGRDRVKPVQSQQNLRVLLEDVITDQLRAQGYTADISSPVSLRIDIMEAMTRVNDSAVNHGIDTKVQLQLVVEAPYGRLVKRYSGHATDEGVMSASIQDMENSMNQVIEAILADIAADDQLHDYLQGKI
ncbi:hypothetical protein VST7929_00799 [Vibrio stylophorae]|uniref:Lipoprotein n=1 Tax=Vibrio stylophorae TaxID=659351 RepID=A0ABM8ZRL9_9VIBR|nr:YajG family lipoprotein [Vibrio stylophorae]CAH0532950.1 hypothetical protein VST7929_00799 [Vibrio stylophorae]